MWRAYALLYLIVLTGRASAQSVKSCPEAQIIAITGTWIANFGKPNERQLKEWDCVAGGEEISLARLSPSGEMTVVYHTGKNPHTERCPTHADCRNAYPVERASEPATPASFPFPGPPSKPVPGLSHYFVGPMVICGEDGRADLKTMLDTPLGRKDHLYMRLIAPAVKDDSWRAVQGYTYPLSDSQPKLYELERVSANNPGGSAWVLIAPNPECDFFTSAFKRLVEYTDAWPKDISREAIWDFRSAYLKGLADGVK